MVQKTVNIEEIFMRQIFLDAFNDKEYTSTMDLRTTLRQKKQEIGKNVEDRTLHELTSSTLVNLRKKGIICKPHNSTPQDGKWTMTQQMLREFRNRFVKRKYYKHKYCNHLETRKVVLKGWDYEITEYRCPILCAKIGNPEIRCDLMQTTKHSNNCWSKDECTMCSGYTKNKSTQESRLISWNLILRDVKKELTELAVKELRKYSWADLEPELRSHLYSNMRHLEINSILNFQELGLIQ